MKILAVDTSSRFGVIGISEDGGTLGELAVQSHETHSARLLPSIDWLLTSLGMTLDDVDGYGVVLGPGSFTGLRVGLSTVKGLAWTKGKPLVGLHSLELLADPFSGLGFAVVPMMDARKERVYAAAYRWVSGKRETILEPCDRPAAEVIEEAPRPLIVVGEGARKYRAEIEKSPNGEGIRFAPETMDVVRGGLLARMAHEAILKGDRLDPVSAEPLYLRLSEAETKERERSRAELS